MSNQTMQEEKLFELKYKRALIAQELSLLNAASDTMTVMEMIGQESLSANYLKVISKREKDIKDVDREISVLMSV
jgi:hypothetical protein